jgi:hypothetical protein
MKFLLLLTFMCVVIVVRSHNFTYFNSKIQSNLLELSIRIVEDILENSKFPNKINLISTNTYKTFKPEDFKQDFLENYLTRTKFSLRHDTENFFSIITGRKKRCNIIVATGFDDFKEIYDKISQDVFKSDGFYLIAFVDGKVTRAQEIFNLMWKKQIFNVNIVFEDIKGKASVQTCMPKLLPAEVQKPSQLSDSSFGFKR